MAVTISVLGLIPSFSTYLRSALEGGTLLNEKNNLYYKVNLPENPLVNKDFWQGEHLKVLD